MCNIRQTAMLATVIFLLLTSVFFSSNVLELPHMQYYTEKETLAMLKTLVIPPPKHSPHPNRYAWTVWKGRQLPSQLPGPPANNETPMLFCSVLKVDSWGNISMVQPSQNPIVHLPVLEHFQQRVQLAVAEYGPLAGTFYFDFDSIDLPTCSARLPSTGRCADIDQKEGECCTSGRPLVGVARNVCCPCSLPLPLHGNQMPAALQHYLNFTDPFAFDQKTARAIWRGAPTGSAGHANFYTRYYNLTHHARTTPRQTILRLSRRRPDLLSASLDRVTMEEFFRYKYIVTVSGNSYAGILKQALLSNSCVIRQEPGASEWYEPLLEEWRHYIPVKYDLSDLLEKIQWAMHHDKECYQMAQESRQFALKHFQSSAVNQFVHMAIRGEIPWG